MDSTPALTLRPLGIGEIFDRAVTLYVRNFVVFTLMVLTLLAPVNVIYYFAIPDQSSALSQAIGQIDHPAKKKTDQKLPFSDREITGLLIVVTIALIFAPFVNNAVAVGVAQLYNGAKPAYGASFAAVFRRWAPLLGTAFLNILILGSVYILTIIGVVLIATVAVLLAPKAIFMALAGALIGIALLLAALLVFLLLLIGYAFSMYAVSLENASPVSAIALAYRRIFSRSELKKAVLMALAYIGLELGVVMLSSMVGLLLLLFIKSYALQLAVNAVVSAMLTAFLTILLAVYYYDVRTRAEGLDLETDLQRLAATAS